MPRMHVLKLKKNLFELQIKTCSKGFEQKVATLRLKTLLKIKENFIGNKTIAKEISYMKCRAKLRC